MKKIPYVIILILIVLNTILAYKIKSNNNDFAKIYSLLNNKIEKNKTEFLTYERNFLKEQENENLPLKGNLKLIDIDGKTILAKDVFKENSVVLRYSELNCHECIDSEINNLVSLKDKIKKEVVLIASYQEPRDLFVFYKEFQKKGLNNIRMYLLSDTIGALPLDKFNVPYYFCVNSGLEMTGFFLPKKEKPTMSKVYLENRLKKFLIQ